MTVGAPVRVPAAIGDAAGRLATWSGVGGPKVPQYRLERLCGRRVTAQILDS
jgi:hypothetical protein